MAGWGREPQSLRIRRYLGLRSFDHAVAADLRDWLRQGALEGRSTAELLSRAEDKLREWRVMLPAVSTLERIAVAEVTYATANLFDVVTSRLPASLRASIDLLVEVLEGDARSSLFRLKDCPKSANAAVIKSDIVRLRLIEELLGTDVAPLGWEHIALTGDYVWSAIKPEPGFRPLRDVRATFPPLAA